MPRDAIACGVIRRAISLVMDATKNKKNLRHQTRLSKSRQENRLVLGSLLERGRQKRLKAIQ